MAIDLEPARSPVSFPITLVIVVWLAALSLATASAWFAFTAVDQVVAHATTTPSPQVSGPAAAGR